jgi:hypothetical protein
MGVGSVFGLARLPVNTKFFFIGQYAKKIPNEKSAFRKFSIYAHSENVSFKVYSRKIK